MEFFIEEASPRRRSELQRGSNAHSALPEAFVDHLSPFQGDGQCPESVVMIDSPNAGFQTADDSFFNGEGVSCACIYCDANYAILGDLNLFNLCVL